MKKARLGSWIGRARVVCFKGSLLLDEIQMLLAVTDYVLAVHWLDLVNNDLAEACASFRSHAVSCDTCRVYRADLLRELGRLRDALYSDSRIESPPPTPRRGWLAFPCSASIPTHAC